MKIGNKEFDTAKHTYIMGILNVTPDSFSDGGKWNGYDAAMRHAEELLEGGTDILDIEESPQDQDTSRLRQKKKLQELRRLSRLSKRILMCRFRLILIRVMWQRQHFRQGQTW